MGLLYTEISNIYDMSFKDVWHISEWISYLMKRHVGRDFILIGLWTSQNRDRWLGDMMKMWWLYQWSVFEMFLLIRGIAQNRSALQKLGITHILNAAHSKRGSIGDQNYYGTSFVYCGIPADDSTYFDLDVYFKPAADFIHKALHAPDGKIAGDLTLTLQWKNTTQVLTHIKSFTFRKDDGVKLIQGPD